MNILKYDPREIRPAQIKALLDVCIQHSGTDPSDWLALPHDIILLQDVPVDHLIYLRKALDRRIKELEEKGV